MKTLLLSLISLIPVFSFAQNPAASLSYIYDVDLDSAWRPNRGVQFGFGMEDFFLGDNFVLSWRLSTDLTKSRFNTTVDSILFDLDDEHDSNLGFANVDYIKRSFALEFDIGFDRGVESKFVPYFTFGPTIENHATWLNYELYQPDPTQSYNNDPTRFTHTVSLGFTSGIGFKLRPLNFLSIDFRTTYYKEWAQNLNHFTVIPEASTFQIDNSGAPQFDFVDRNYARGLKFRVGIILHIINAGGGYSPSNDSDENDSNSDSNPDAGSGGRGSGTTLTPKSGRGG